MCETNPDKDGYFTLLVIKAKYVPNGVMTYVKIHRSKFSPEETVVLSIEELEKAIEELKNPPEHNNEPPVCPVCGEVLRSSPDIDDSPPVYFCPNENCEYNLDKDDEDDTRRALDVMAREGMVSSDELDEFGEMDEYYPSDSDETDKDLP